jgi:hypothetical protein
VRYESIMGGRLADLLIKSGDTEVNRTAKSARVYNGQYDTSCNLEILGIIDQKRVAKLCKKRRIDAERFNQLLREVQWIPGIASPKQ